MLLFNQVLVNKSRGKNNKIIYLFNLAYYVVCLKVLEDFSRAN